MASVMVDANDLRILCERAEAAVSKSSLRDPGDPIGDVLYRLGKASLFARRGGQSPNEAIVERLAEHGIDAERLAKVLEPKGDNWGELVHAFEVLTVLGVVADALKERSG